MKPKIIFMGTPTFGAIILEKLIKSGNKPFLVITAQDKPVGRKQISTAPAVKVLSEKYNIPVAQPEKIKGYAEEITKMKPDLIIVASFGKLIPKEILDIPSYGCLNVHPSLLPKYRGASPIQSAILNGDKKTGVTIMRLSEKLDTGSILVQQELEIKNPKFQELHDKLAELGAGLLVETIPKLLAGRINPQAQDESKATYTKILTKEDGKIDWRKPAEQIERQIRAFDPWPGSYCQWQIANGKSQILKIIEVDVLSEKSGGKIGEVLLAGNKQLAVQCGQNCLIVRKLQLEGKKPILSQDFLRGHRDFIGAVLQ